MKLNYKIFTLAAVSLLLVVTSCKKHSSGPSDEEIQLTKLSAIWKLTSVTQDAVVQDGFEDFSLTLSGTSKSSSYVYTTAGRPPLGPWPASGSWSFGSNALTQLIRDKGTNNELPMTYVITDTSLELNFQFSGDGYSSSRAGAVSGNWNFKFSK